MSKIFDLDKFDAFAKRATLGNFRLVNTNRIEWDCSNGCDNPQLVAMVFAERQQRQFHNGKYRDLTRDFINYERCEKNWFNDKPMIGGERKFIDLLVPCRKCETCLAKRSYMWFFRAKNEFGLSCRTWFGTLTLSPERHYWCECQGNWSSDELEQLRIRHSVISKEITKYIKRLRKTGAVFRYLLVLECHKSGLPHYHLLCHEQSCDNVLRKKILQDKWTWGFSSWKLAQDANSCAYVAKYLSKSMLARVRASENYGDPLRSLRSVHRQEAPVLPVVFSSPTIPIQEDCSCPF